MSCDWFISHSLYPCTGAWLNILVNVYIVTQMVLLAAILAAKAGNLPLSVRGGGHSYTCNSVKTGSVQVSCDWLLI